MPVSRHRFIYPIFFSLLVFAVGGCATGSVVKPHDSSSALVLWSSPESRARLARSVNGDFFSLASFYEPQINKFNCGPASGTILLNALLLQSQASKPTDRSSYPLKEVYLSGGFDPVFAKFTQNTFFNQRTDRVKTRDVFYGKPNALKKQDGGLMLAQWAQILEIHGLRASIYPVESLAAQAEQRSIILQSLKDQSSYIVVNFDRKVLGQSGGGHISPLVAYDEASDSFLVLDVNPVVTEWFWVTSQDLFAAMHTKDGDQFRGFAKVERAVLP